MSRVVTLLVFLLAISSVSCTPQSQFEPAAPAAEATTPAGSEAESTSPAVLRLATTTSTADSGLLDVILPAFEEAYRARVEVLAVGTGQALALGENGDADVVLVHARSREDEFVEGGFGVDRRDVMYNDFVIVGPSSDPAGITTMTGAAEALATIAEQEAPFASRGDESGTHTKEMSLWAAAGLEPTAEMAWYRSLGQGMGETLITANEMEAYTIADRGTFLAMGDSLPNLTILVGGETIAENQDPALRNPYGIIPVNPERHPHVNAELTEQFAAWLTSPETQAAIGEYGADEFGQPLFYPVQR